MKSHLESLFGLDEKKALVTGAAKGLGREIVRALAFAGADVACADIDSEGVAKTAEEARQLGKKAQAITLDCASEESVVRGVAEAHSALGGLDILVNNAGIFPPAPIEKMSADLLEKVLSVNLKGAFFCMREAAKIMKQGEGGGVGCSIINIASIDGLHPSFPGLSAYGASKAGMIHLTKSGAIELGPSGITVNAICPGGIRTEGTAPAFDAGLEARLVKRIPLKRVGAPEDVVGIVITLAGPSGRYVNGAVIVIDGGYLQS